ncbi:MAG TPA: cytochrome c biogenesis protein CcsA [Candidatus Acidoferrum sp.]|nr:cytochrome c biogenesis protein CcsA [Candidatus Acidoferrum sp.]
MTGWVLATLLLYVLSFAAYLRNLYVENKAIGLTAAASLAAGLALHYFALMERAQLLKAVPYEDLWGSLSLFAWLLGATFLCLELVHRGRAFGPFILPLVIALFSLSHFRDVSPHPAPARGALFALHVTLNILAYSAFSLAFVLSTVYLIQNRLLRARKPGGMLWRFPPMDVLERMCRSSAFVGVLSLAAGIACGFVWADRLHGHYWSGDPKEIVSLLILVLYLTYLWLSRGTAWRGSRAAVLCLCNFAFVLFSYSIVNIYLSRYHRFY